MYDDFNIAIVTVLIISNKSLKFLTSLDLPAYALVCFDKEDCIAVVPVARSRGTGSSSFLTCK